MIEISYAFEALVKEFVDQKFKSFQKHLLSYQIGNLMENMFSCQYLIFIIFSNVYCKIKRFCTFRTEGTQADPKYLKISHIYRHIYITDKIFNISPSAILTNVRLSLENYFRKLSFEICKNLTSTIKNT